VKPGTLRFDGVSKVFRWTGAAARHETLKGWFFRRGATPEAAREHVALDGVDLHVHPGEVVALVGPNGSGKSTTLKLAGGILGPTRGTVETRGRITALIELGAGFHPEITGRENVLINGMLLGLSRREIEDRMPAILDFADLGDFIGRPVKTYSSGMYVRLGFAVAVSTDPDILLIDEVLSVGDEAFTARCLDRLARMRRRGVTMVVVSHDLDMMASFADRAVYLNRGRVVADGPADGVVARYRSDVAGAASRAEVADRPPVRMIEEGRRWGNGDVEILDVRLEVDGRPVRLVPSGSPCAVVIRYRARRAVTDFVFGLAWHTADGTLVGGHNTDIDGLTPRTVDGEGAVSCSYPSIDLAAGEYTLDAAVHAADGLAYDYWCRVARVTVTAPAPWPGAWAPPHRWSAGADLWDEVT
jgi:lipopolysaccharide transport system ATP-binding protein